MLSSIWVMSASVGEFLRSSAWTTAWISGNVCVAWSPYSMQESDTQLYSLAVTAHGSRVASCTKTAPSTEHLERSIENRVFSIAIH
jgi:hypothetical protein